MKNISGSVEKWTQSGEKIGKPTKKLKKTPKTKVSIDPVLKNAINLKKDMTQLYEKNTSKELYDALIQLDSVIISLNLAN